MATRSTQSTRPVTLSRWRINAVLLVAALAIGRIVFQLANLQLVQHEYLSGKARAEIDRRVTIQPSRGVIRDSKGNVLAIDVDRESLYINPNLFDPKNAPKLALVLSGLLGMPASEIQARLEDREHYSRIARWLEPEIAERITALAEPGIELVPEPRRIYPQGNYAAHTIGAVNFEGVGISGVEGFYDTELKGITGTITAEWDGGNNPIWITPPQTQPASDGADLELTLDPLVQHVVESELKQAIDAHDADGGTVIVLDVRTGAIRGMASYPTFDPNHYTDYKPEEYNLNPAVGKLYEPGSTFKIVTISAGLQSGAFTTETQVDDPGVVERYGWPLHNFDSGGHGPITPADVLYYSSNIGALLFNEITGPEKFYKMVAAFGYGQPTGVDLAGESDGIYLSSDSPDWGPLDLDTNAFGQSVAVTPLQQVRMVAAVGNDGKLMRPYIVQRRCHANNCVGTKPQQVGQPISPEVARTIRQMLVRSGNHYVNQIPPDDLWLVPGYAVSAKTGTSQVPNGEGGYEDWTIGSVVGLAPAENARYAILVKIDHPKDDIWGVRTALLPYRNIAAQLLRYERIAPDPSMVGPEQVAGVIR
ncbi:MAG: peptidoglycan D,D-transpeptidase FtsI family protein [Roseiflexaceae bacterium]